MLTLQVPQRELSWVIIVPCFCRWLPLAEKNILFCPFSVTREEAKNPETLFKTGRTRSVSGAIFPFLVTAWSRERIPVVCLYPPVLMLPRDRSRNILWNPCGSSTAGVAQNRNTTALLLSLLPWAQQCIETPFKLNSFQDQVTSIDYFALRHQQIFWGVRERSWDRTWNLRYHAYIDLTVESKLASHQHHKDIVCSGLWS